MASQTTVHLSEAEFDQTLASHPEAVIVDFWAEWCGPCKMISPVLEEIAGTQDKISIVKLNVDENPVTGANERIMSLPTLNLYQGGRVVKQIVGARPKAAILAGPMTV